MATARESMKWHADVARALAADMPRLAAGTDAESVVLRIADSLACALGAEALAETAGGIVRTVAQARLSSGSGASIWWSGAETASDTAALRNSVAVRFLDYNDTYVGRAIVHPSDVVPSLVALAEEREATWERLLESVSVAYEVLCRIADVINLREHGFDGSTLSPLGVAAGAAWLLGLSEETATEAIRLAALDAGMLRVVRQGRLSDWKTVASGRGAVKGLFAVRMAEAGAKAPLGAFEGPDSFCERIGGTFTYPDDGEPRLQRTILKAYPAQIFTQGMIELAFALRQEIGGEIDCVKKINVATFRLAVDMVGGHGRGPEILNRETADHSAPFAIAAVLVSGGLKVADYDALLRDRRVYALMQRIEVHEDAAASKAFPEQFPIEITAFLSDGSTRIVGHARPTSLSAEGLQAKFDQLWPNSIPRGWRWKLKGEAPRFPMAMG